MQAYVFKSSSTDCAAFLENSGDMDVKIQFQNIWYQLPPKSISILPGCKNVAFNTAKVQIKCTIHTYYSIHFVETPLFAVFSFWTSFFDIYSLYKGVFGYTGEPW